jgi:hypothetical protein
VSRPNLTVTAEPVERSSPPGDKLVFARLAAASSEDAPDGQLLLHLRIKSNEGDEIELSKLILSFAGPPSVPAVEIPVQTIKAGTSAPSPGLTIQPGATEEWKLLEHWNPDVILPLPAPASVKVSLFCRQNFTDPWETTLPLAEYASPVTGGGYAFPTGTSDLGQGEFWVGHSSSDYHRACGFDLFVQAYASPTKQWTTLLPHANPSQPGKQEFRAWGNEVFAIADGHVETALDGRPDRDVGAPADPIDSRGNHAFIRHGIQRVLYAHFMEGTLTQAGIASGVNVVKGQLLGRIGNSGNATEPHLHISIEEPPFRPLPFSDVYVLDRERVPTTTWPPTALAPWNRISGECLPSRFCVIWPGPMRAAWKRVLRRIWFPWLPIPSRLRRY